jgi:hypothetical protein
MASIGVRREITIEPWFERRAIMRQRKPDKGLGLGFAEGSMAFEIDIEAGRRRGDENVERLAGGGEGLRNRARGRQGPVHRRRRAPGRSRFQRARLHESGGWPPLSKACVKDRAAATRAMRIGEVRNLVGEAGPPQGAGDKIAFPSRIRIRRKRLHRAAAATRKIAAERRDPMRAWG